MALLTLAASLLANAAWLDGLARTGSGWQLSGIHTLNSGDTPTYFSWIDQARRGDWLFRQLYTTEPHERALFHPLFLALGGVARALDLSSVEAYHAGRVALGLLVVPLVYVFFAACLPHARRRLSALVILLFASGLGWIWLWAGADPSAWPIDLWVPEAFVFMSLVESPLNLAAYGLWAMVGLASLRGLERGGAGALAAAFGAAALLSAVRPHAGAAPLTALVVLGGGVLVLARRVAPRRALATGGALLAGVGVGLVAPLHALLSGPAFSGWREEIVGTAPSPVALVAGLAWPLGLALLGVRPLLARAPIAGPWIVSWFAVIPLLVFAPVGPQLPFARKLLEALPLPLAVLAAEGLARALRSARWRDWPRGLRAGVPALLLALAFASHAVLIERDARAFAGRAWPLVLPACQVDAFDALALLGEARDAVLAPPALGALLPGYTGHTIVCCHYDQTLDRTRKESEVQSFYGRGPSPREELLRRYGVRFVVYPSERPPPRELESALSLEMATDCLRVYRVLEP